MGNFQVGSIPLGDHDADWFKVMSKLGDRSIRANMASIVGYYVRRRKDEYKEILAYTAKKYGLTEDETFYRLLNDIDLGEPVDNFSEEHKDKK
jgi:hypothetical protein